MISVYKQEVVDGVAAKVKATASIKYDAPMRFLKPDSKLPLDINDVPELAKSSISDNWDLYPFSSVLVSVGWNGNDDVFDAGEAFMARNSPVNKQLNYMHDEKTIIGHMTKAIVMDVDGNIINEDQEIIPDFYDIVVANVLYRKWSDEARQELVDKIIAGIPENEWFVSMECLFRGFDYALISPEGEHKVIHRNHSTAFLTKHLRAYGGTGVYEDHKIGRMIRNLTFSGNAVVDNPANPRSIIFNETDPFKSTATQVSFPKQEKTNMADSNDILVAQLKEEVAKANSRYEKLEEKFEKQVAEAQQAEQDRLEKQIASLKVDVEESEKKVEAKDKSLTETQEQLEALQKEHKQLVAEMDETKKKLEKSEKDKAKANRVSKLVDSNVPLAQAEALTDKFDSLNDEQFDAIVEIQAEFFKDKEKKEEKKDDKKDKAKAEKEQEDADAKAAAKALEDAKVDDKHVTPNGEENTEAELSTAMMSWFADIREKQDK